MSGASEQQHASNDEGAPALQQQPPSAESLAYGLNAWRWAAFDANRPFCAPWTVLQPYIPIQDAIAAQQPTHSATGNLSSLLTDDQAPEGSSAPSASAAPNGWNQALPALFQAQSPPVPQLSASFALAISASGEVSHTCSGLLNDASRYPHFAAAREYLIGALRLDAAAHALRARLEDPTIAATLDCKPEMLMGALAPHHLAMASPQFAAHLAAAARGGTGGAASALAGSTSSAGKALAYSKLVRKASRGVFKRIIRRMLQTPDGSLPLCTSNRCIIPGPGTEETPPLLDMQVPTEQLTGAVSGAAGLEAVPAHMAMQPAPGSVLFPPSSQPGGMISQGHGAERLLCAAGGTCAPTRAALNWPDDLPCVDPSKVSIPVDKAIGLMEWVQSLGHDVPELQELQGLKKRPSGDTETKRHVKPRASAGAVRKGEGGSGDGNTADDDAVAGLAALRAAPVEDDE
ncbi:g1510 [Coccomyxa elongata]